MSETTKHLAEFHLTTDGRTIQGELNGKGRDVLNMVASFLDENPDALSLFEEAVKMVKEHKEGSDKVKKTIPDSNGALLSDKMINDMAELAAEAILVQIDQKDQEDGPGL